MLHFPRNIYAIPRYYRALHCFYFIDTYGDWVMDEFGTAVRINIDQANYFLDSNEGVH